MNNMKEIVTAVEEMAKRFDEQEKELESLRIENFTLKQELGKNKEELKKWQQIAMKTNG